MKEKEDKNLTDSEVEKVSGGQSVLDMDDAKQEDTQVSLYEHNSTKAQKWVLEQDKSGNVTVKHQK